MCCWKLFETFQTYHGGLVIWNFQMRHEMRCAIWNFLNFSTHHRGCLFQTFRWELKGNMLYETFELFGTWNCLNISRELLIWNFQMRLEIHQRGCLFETFRWDLKWDVLFETFWNFWNFSNLSWRVAYLKLSDETWNEMCYLKLFKLFNPLQGLLISNFQMRIERRYAIWNIWNVWNLKLFKHITGVAYLKLSDETWDPSKGLLIWNF